MNEPLKKSDPQVVKELAKEAESLRNNRAFVVATQLLQKQLYGQLLDPKIDDEMVKTVRAQLMVLEAIPNLLDHLIASQTMAQRKPHAPGRI